jgi:hypothetical protein
MANTERKTGSKSALRSNFPRGSYPWTGRAAQWRSLGIPEVEQSTSKELIHAV